MNAAPRPFPNQVQDTAHPHKRKVTSCPVCDARRFQYLFSVGNHRLVRCHECAFTLLNPQPGDQELAEIHGRPYLPDSDAPARKTAFAQLRLQTAETHLDQLVAYAGPARGKLLEIGCGGGFMQAAAARRGFQVTGVDSSADACEAARAQLATEGLPGEIICGEIAAVAGRAGEFDACIVGSVIGHIRDPRRFVQAIHELLRPEGVIFVATPSLDSWPAQLMSARWAEFKPEHLFYFNRKTLESLLFSQGFRTLTWRPDYRILNYDYLRDHFENFPAPLFTRVVKTAALILRTGFRSRKRRLIASGMVVMGRRVEQRLRPRLSIIVPAFNEAPTFRAAFNGLLAHPFPAFDVEYLVVESNSTDGTREMVKEFADHPGVRILLEDRPRGKGHAVRTGLRACQGDFIAIQDADLEYDLDDYDALLEPLAAHREAFVLGARHGGRSWKMRQFAGQPLTSSLFNFGHWFFTTLLNVTLGVRLKDPFTMFKLFRRDCIHDLEFEANRFDFDWELVIKLIRKGYTPVEIPVNYRSRSFHEGKKVSVIRDPLSWFVALAKFRFQRLGKRVSPEAQVISNPR